jgi:hypothetical protein
MTPLRGEGRLARAAWIVSSLATAVLVGTLLWSLLPRPQAEPSRDQPGRGAALQLLSPTGRVPRDTPFVWSSPVRADHFNVVVLDSSNAVVFAAHARTERLDPGAELWTRLAPGQAYTWSVEAFDEDDRALAASGDQTFTYAPER